MGVAVVEAGGKEIHWEGQVEIVSKTLILKKTLKTFFLENMAVTIAHF